MRLGFLFGLLVVCAPSIARAEPTEVVALTYRAPAACPDEHAFVTAVQARTARASFAADGARRFSVLLEKRADAFHGRLSVSGATRELSSPRCEDLFDAFVLFVAIAIDPEPPPPPAEDGTKPLETETEAPPTPPPPRPHLPPPRPPPARPVAWHWSFGSGALLANGVADRALVSAHPFVDRASDALGVSPSVRVSLLWANGGAQAAPGSQADLTVGLRALALSGCAFRFQGPPFTPSVRVCGAFEGGWLTVRPYGLAYPTSPERPWVAAGPLARAEVPLLPRLALGADVGALFPFERERVYVRGNAAGALVGAVGVRFAVVLVVTGF